MRVFLVWKRRCADVRAGTQAPPLHISFGWIARGTVDLVWVDCVWTVGFVWVDCVWTVGFVWVDCAWVVLFVCWENGTHEPTPSVLYFCQPRVADDRRLSWERRWERTYAIGIVLFKINFRVGNHSRIIHSPRVVMMCDEKKYNPQGGSILACIITQGRLRCTCQPCAIESIPPMG